MSWLWPKDIVCKTFSSSSKTASTAASPRDLEEDLDRWDRERAFDIADSLECGLAREIATEFMHPLRRSSKLWRFHVVRSEDKMQYRLFSDGGDFLMYARAHLEACRVDLFLYDPSEEGRLYDPSRPAFTMSFSKDKSEWRLVQERCEHCRSLPQHLSCSSRGKQQVATIRHSREPIGDGIFNCMEVQIPSLYSDGSRVVWCPMLGRGDLAGPHDDDAGEVQTLFTKQPTWNDEVESLVLDFKGRNILSSAKNFQLSQPQKPGHVVCQYGKIGPTTFSLDFKYPLSVVQAFGMSLTTLFWT